MDFKDTPEEAAYRQQVATGSPPTAPKKAEGGDPEGGDNLAAAKAWQAKKAAAGYAAASPGPRSGADRAARPVQKRHLRQEEARHPTPRQPVPDRPGHVRAHGHDLRRRGNQEALRRPGHAWRGDSGASSSPSRPAGRMWLARAPRAELAPDGSGDWIINGQKVWTTGAQFSDYGIVIVRTNPDVPKHKGLTMFWIDMKDPGVEVKPIHQMSGGSGFQRGLLHRPAGEGQPAAGRRGRWLEGQPGHPDERKAGGGRLNRRRLERVHGGRAPDARPGRRLGAHGPGPAREAGRLVRPGRGPEAHPQPHHDGRSSRGQTPGLGKLHRQDHLRRPDAGPGQHGG
jgi:hypothetical protein